MFRRAGVAITVAIPTAPHHTEYPKTLRPRPRAALMEGRLTNLEQHQVRTGSQTITSQWSQGESSLSFTIPANTILCAIDSVQTDANGYAGGRFGARLYCSVNGNTARVSSSNSDVRVRAATIIYAYYA